MDCCFRFTAPSAGRRVLSRNLLVARPTASRGPANFGSLTSPNLIHSSPGWSEWTIDSSKTNTGASRMKPVLCVTLLALMAGLLPVVATPTEGGLFEESLAAAFQSRFEVTEKTILQLQAALEAGEVTSKELVELYLERIAAYDQDGPRLNAIRHVNRKARRLAHQRDHDRRHGKAAGPLFGIPIIVKDNINTKDQPTTAGSLALQGSVPPDDAFIIKRLEDAGAIV